ncbi:MAG: hypothetical protein FWF98_03145 [Dehalococcoidia bacterium]|nr:hypothetical protein [Dehalococcoidia bacterium]
MNTKLIIVISMCAVLACLILIPVFWWVPIAIGSCTAPNPPRPEITYGEFPFRIEYEILGERFVVEDTVICEFDGFGWGGSSSKYRKWKSHLASGQEGNLVILKVFNDTKNIVCNVGQSKYYMGELTIPPDEYWPPEAFLREGSGASLVVLHPEEWYDDYNFKFISWEFTEPIVNTFK